MIVSDEQLHFYRLCGTSMYSNVLDTSTIADVFQVNLKGSGSLKVHKHEIILNFFLPKSNPYMPFGNFQEKFRFFSFDFRQNFDVRAVTEHTRNKIFWRDIQQFFFKIFTLVLLDRFLDGFSKF